MKDRVHTREQLWVKIELFMDHIQDLIDTDKYWNADEAKCVREVLKEFTKESAGAIEALQDDERLVAIKINRIERMMEKLKGI